MPLTLTLSEQSQIPLEVDSIRLETVREQACEQVVSTLIQRGNKQIPLGDFFRVTGSASTDNTIVWEGDCSRVKLIGTGLSDGKVRIAGNAGMHLGAEMSGGEIVVEGDTADWLGAEMKGGRIVVRGNAGHLVGAVYRGGRRGMTGGEIFVHGSAGNEIGHTMRRGLIVIGGKSGDAPGFNMIAGTIVLCGEMGIRPGAGMRRGSIIYLSGDRRPRLLPTFRASGEVRSPFLNIYFKHIQNNGFTLSDEIIGQPFSRYAGDFVEMGKGEILVPAQAG